MKEKRENDISACLISTLFGGNVLFALTGVSLLCFGIWLHFRKSEVLKKFDESASFDLAPSITLSLIGGIMILFGIIGAVATVTYNERILKFYITINGLLVINSIALIILISASKHLFIEVIGTRLNDTIIQYHTVQKSRNFVDYFQSSYDCCGIFGPADWNEHICIIEDSAVYIYAEANELPYSCCDFFASSMPLSKQICKQEVYGPMKNVNYTIGRIRKGSCKLALAAFVKVVFYAIYCVAGASISLQVFNIVVAIRLSMLLNRQERLTSKERNAVKV